MRRKVSQITSAKGSVAYNEFFDEIGNDFHKFSKWLNSDDGQRTLEILQSIEPPPLPEDPINIDFWLDDSFFARGWFKDDRKVLQALEQLRIEMKDEQANISLYGTDPNDVVAMRRLDVIKAVLGAALGIEDGRGDLLNAIQGLEVKYGIDPIDNGLTVGIADIEALMDRQKTEIARSERSDLWKAYYDFGESMQEDGFYLDLEN